MGLRSQTGPASLALYPSESWRSEAKPNTEMGEGRQHKVGHVPLGRSAGILIAKVGESAMFNFVMTVVFWRARRKHCSPVMENPAPPGMVWFPETGVSLPLVSSDLCRAVQVMHNLTSIVIPRVLFRQCNFLRVLERLLISAKQDLHISFPNTTH